MMMPDVSGVDARSSLPAGRRTGIDARSCWGRVKRGMRSSCAAGPVGGLNGREASEGDVVDAPGATRGPVGIALVPVDGILGDADPPVK